MRVLCLLPLIASTALAAADAAAVAAHRPEPLAVYGGDAVLAGQPVVATRADAVTRMELAGFREGHVDLRPGTTLSLSTEPAERAGRRRLVVQLDGGAARIDVHGTGPYDELRVRGAALDVRVTGTLFVVERVRHDADYVSLLRGHLVVSLKRAVAEALKQPGKVDLDSHQAVGGSTAGGLGSVAAVGSAPALGVRVDGSAADDPFAPELPPPTADLAGTVFDGLADDLGNTVIGELGGTAGGIGTEIAGNASGAAGGFVLGGPPPPP